MLNVFSCMYSLTSFLRTFSSQCHLCLAVRLKWEMKQMLLQGWLTLSPGLLATVWCTRIPEMTDSNSRHLELQWGTIWLCPSLKTFLESNASAVLYKWSLFAAWSQEARSFLKGTSWTCCWLSVGTRGPLWLETHWFLPGAGFCWSREPHFPDIRWKKVSMDSSWPKHLGLDICSRHGGFLAEQPKKMSRRQGA